MEFTALELLHRDKINSYLSAQRIESSELTFLTFYIWRKAFSVKFAEAAGCLVMQFQDKGFPPSLRFPLGRGDKKHALEEACEHFIKNGLEPRFYGLTRDMTEELLSLCPNGFTVKPMNDYFDYVYSVERLINLSGSKLHGKRNHVNRFKTMYKYEYVPVVQGDYDEIMPVYEGWLSGRESDYYLDAEKESIGDTLKNFDVLGCKGAKLYADGRLCAFTIGEPLNGNTAVIHIEKADMKVRGAYPAINQMFLENEWSGFEFVNREDDFGVEGLRRAKKSYHPEFMIEKYSAVLKK